MKSRNLVKVKPQWKFVSMEEGVEPVVSETFEGAWRAMYKWVRDRMDGLTFQALETSIWIESTSGTPMFFYDARDLAIEMGLMAKIEAEEKALNWIRFGNQADRLTKRPT